jgi:hypothetical protein
MVLAEFWIVTVSNVWPDPSSSKGYQQMLSLVHLAVVVMLCFCPLTWWLGGSSSPFASTPHSSHCCWCRKKSSPTTTSEAHERALPPPPHRSQALSSTFFWKLRTQSQTRPFRARLYAFPCQVLRFSCLVFLCSAVVPGCIAWFSSLLPLFHRPAVDYTIQRTGRGISISSVIALDTSLNLQSQLMGSRVTI